jgi:uncharacterized protein YegP (UPF0339 family)
MNFFKLTVALTAALVLAACGVEQTETTGPDELGDTSDALTTGKFETFVGKDGKSYFHLLAGNGEKVLQSQGYTTAASAADGIASVKANGVDTSRYLTREASDGSSYFVLTAKNGAIIGMSQMYVSASNVTRAIGSVVSIVKTTVTAPAVIGARFETFKGLDGKYYFHARAGNGEIVLASQAYTTSTSAKNGIASVTTNGATAARYEVLAAADGQYFFHLKAANGQVIARGESYASKSNAQRGVETCVGLLSGSDIK